MPAQYRVALIGCGQRGRMHLIGALADDRCEIVALADVNRESAEKLKAEHALSAVTFTDHVEMLKEVRPDVVITSLWTPLHLPVFRDCVAAGVRAVLSEKPMAPTWGDCLEMGRLADEAGCQLTFSHQRRFAAGNLLVRRLLREGRFGRIERFDLYTPKNLLDCGTHIFDQVLSFNDESPAEWVMGAIDASEKINWFNVAAENMATGLVAFQNGARATFQCGTTGQDMGTGVRALGSEGMIELDWDGHIRRAVVYGDPGWKLPPLPADDGSDYMVVHMTAMVRHDIDCLASGAEPDNSHRKALRASEIIFALYESARRRERVTLPIETRDNAFHTMLAKGEINPRSK